ncbi:MAG: heparinase II/III domain-containing protein [Mycobacteriales bacterium]|nr:MAG: hypothetical protein DLM56_12435 [Pseudonocardiales bacterium]
MTAKPTATPVPIAATPRLAPQPGFRPTSNVILHLARDDDPPAGLVATLRAELDAGLFPRLTSIALAGDGTAPGYVDGIGVETLAVPVAADPTPLAARRWMHTLTRAVRRAVRAYRPALIRVWGEQAFAAAAQAVGQSVGIPVVSISAPSADGVIGMPVKDGLALYRSLGAVDEDRRLAAGSVGVDYDRVRAVARSGHRRRYERIGLGRRGDPRDGWRTRGSPTVRLDLPIDWERLCAADRSWAFRLHAWDFVTALLARYEDDDDHDALVWCRDRALSWLEAYPHYEPSTASMAWYDMGIGLRAMHLGYVVQASADDEGVDDATWRRLVDGVRLHLRALTDDRLLAMHSNHGLYVAAGELALAERLAAMPGAAWHHDRALERLATILGSQFGSDGGHLEHSPGYHHQVTTTARSLVDAGLVAPDSAIARQVHRAQEIDHWFVTPTGEIAGFGDTEPGREYRSAPFPTSAELLALPVSGYAVARAPDGGYLAQITGFHSRVHKHADDLSLIWYERGAELLIDPGKYGYVQPDPRARATGNFYADPSRMHVESTRAHNTVEIDGRDHDRLRAPTGSGLLAARRDGTRIVVDSATDHGAVRHRRRLVYAPGDWLLIVDDVVDRDALPHDVRQWFLLPDEQAIEPIDAAAIAPGGFVGAGCGGRRLWIVPLGGATAIAPVRGQRLPVLRGWRSAAPLTLTPAWSCGFGQLSVATAHFVTLLALADHCPRPSSAGHAGVTRTARWWQDGGVVSARCTG